MKLDVDAWPPVLEYAPVLSTSTLIGVSAGEDPRQRAEADVVGRAVAADGHHRRQQARARRP